MDYQKIQRYSLLELALLAVFMAGLLIALLVVQHRARVDLSDRLSLPGSGLAVSIPVGDQWNSTQAWQYEESENSMILISEFVISGRSGMVVRWRYCLSTPAGSDQELLEQRARRLGALVQGGGTIGRQFPMAYAQMLFSSDPQQEVYLGLMRLNAKRSIELLVTSSGLGSSYPENVLKSLVEGIDYQPGSGLADGKGLIQQFLNGLSTDSSQQTPSDEAFLIKGTGSKNLGYYYTHHIMDDDGILRSTVQQMESNSWRLKSEIRMDALNQTYRWQTELNFLRAKGAQVYTIAPNDNGELYIKRNEKEIKIFPSGQFFLPEPHLNKLAAYFMQTEYTEVIVDVLSATGRLVPVRLGKISSEQASAKSEDVDSVVRVDYLHELNSYEELFFDAALNLLGKFEQAPNRNPRVWNAVSVDQLQQTFQKEFQRSGDKVACK
jgi:hypothetical protein